MFAEGDLPMLSMISEFSVLDIDSIKMLKKGAVYLVQGNGPDIVVKKEELHATQAQHFDLNKKTMGAIDKDVKASKRLSASEVSALTSFVVHEKHMLNAMLQGGLPGGTADLDDSLNALGGKIHGTSAVWYKMPVMQRMDNLADAWNSAMGALPYGDGPVAQSSNLMTTFLKTLKGSGGLESLGQIISADLFSGNRDRVAPKLSKQDYKQVSYPNGTYRLNSIKNIGNLMIVNNGKAATITGMDFIDPTTAYISVTRSLDSLNSAVSWDGYTIVDPTLRKAFAKSIVEDLEKIFASGTTWKTKKSFFGSSDKTALGVDAHRRLQEGMVKGARKIVKYFDERKGAKTYPASILERVKEYRKI